MPNSPTWTGRAMRNTAGATSAEGPSCRYSSTMAMMMRSGEDTSEEMFCVSSCSCSVSCSSRRGAF